LALLHVSVTTCPSVSTSRVSLASMPGLCKRLESSEVTVWALMHLRSSTSRLCSRSYFMPPPLGGVSPLRLISNSLKHSCIEESGSTCTVLSTPRCHNMCRILMMNSSVLWWQTLVTCYITCYLNLPDRTSHPYTLRPRRHDCSLTIKEDARNFVIRLLYKDMY